MSAVLPVLPENSPHPESKPPVPEKSTGGSWVIALLFWAILLMAAACYGLVALSPKLTSYLHLRNEHYQNQVQLVKLERKAGYLRKVTHALEHDPQFAAEQARVELHAEREGEERIAVDESLFFSPDADFDVSKYPASILPWYLPLLDVFAADEKMRRGLLIAAALMTVFAFTFLQESQTAQWRALARSIRNSWLRATARYRRPAEQEVQGARDKGPEPDSLKRQ